MGTVHVFRFLFLSICLFYVSITEAKGGFSLNLIHRDSPESPFYNPNETHYQRVAKAIQRSVNRLNYLESSVIRPNTAQSHITDDSGSYLMKISLGTPPVDILAIADTGSGTTWTQCKPCTQCFKQNAPLFDPTKSSTFKNIDCRFKQCAAFHGSRCSRNKLCSYSITYNDGSFSRGYLAYETVTLGSTDGKPTVLPNIIIGCAHEASGSFKPSGTGIIGLSRDSLSLPSQIGSLIDGKFSYCLVPIGSRGSSKINFGTNSVVSGSGVATTPMVKHNTHYFLTLDAISVGSNKIPYGYSSSAAPKGSIIIDSGSVLTSFPHKFFIRLIKAVSDEIKVKPVQPFKSPKVNLDLCYPYSPNFRAPRIIMHFRNANVELDVMNTFVRSSETVMCFAFTESDRLPIYGNLAQVNFLVGYDTQKNTVSFKRTDCTKS